MFDEIPNTSSEIWPLVQQLVDAWESDPVVGRYPDLVKRLLETSTNDFAAQREDYLLKQAFQQAPMMAACWFQFDGIPNDLLSRGTIVGQQYVDQTMWLRSRMPGFPFLCLPHMASGSHLTSQPVGNFPWRLDYLKVGLQNTFVPPGIVGVTVSATSHQLKRRDSLLALSTGIRSLPNFQRLADAWKLLTSEDRDALRQSKTEAARQLMEFDEQIQTGARVDLYAERRHRKDIIDSLVEQLPDGAKEFCAAFDTLDETIDLIAGSVFEQLFVFDVCEVEIADSTITLSDADGLLRFDPKDSYNLRMGRLISLPALPGKPIARVESQSLSILSPNDDGSSWVRARVLLGT